MLFTIMLTLSILSFLIAIILVVPYLRKEFRAKKSKEKG